MLCKCYRRCDTLLTCSVLPLLASCVFLSVCLQMDVVYEGPVRLTESQVNTLLGYQNPLNKFVNWNITRTQVCLGATCWSEAAAAATVPFWVAGACTCQRKPQRTITQAA